MAFLAENLGLTKTTGIQYGNSPIGIEIARCFLDLMAFIRCKHAQGYPSWESTASDHHIFAMYFGENPTNGSWGKFIPRRKNYWRHLRTEPMIRVYYQPLIGRFSVDQFIPQPNKDVPSVHTHLRIERKNIPNPEQGLQGVIIDLSLQHYYGTNRYNNNNEIIDLVDLRYGPNRHHVPIAYGPPQECCRFIHSIMDTLGFGNLIVSPENIPNITGNNRPSKK